MKISINVVSPFESGGFNTYNKYLVNNIAKLDKKNYYYIYVDYNNFKNYQIYQPNIKIIKKSQLLNNSALRIIWMQFILPFTFSKLLNFINSTSYIYPFCIFDFVHFLLINNC